MGTKRKAEDEILEIPSDDDDGSDSDVQIQEKPIPIVTVDDDDDSPKRTTSHSTPVRPSPDGEEASHNSSLKTPPPPPDISNRSSSEVEEKQPMPEAKMSSENLLLSMQFRDQELFQLFKGSLSEYLKTTFQLKMGGEEVDVVQQADRFSIQVLSKANCQKPTTAATASAECITPVQSKEAIPAAEKDNVDTSEKDGDTDGMFVIDSTPAKTAKGGPIIPSYKKALQKVLDNSPTAVSADSATKRPKPKQNCWNCDGDHGLKDCKQPRNFAKIDKMKQAFMKMKDRYHVDLEQKYGHIVPGRLSSELRQALGLRKRDIPAHIYRMRLFGYPPGWLEDAKITHSGLQLFNSNGNPEQGSDESEGEVDNVRPTKFDVRKIISFPGFNVDAGDAIDNSKFYGVPPRMGHQSRDEMIRNLEGTLVQGYRRKKLRLDRSARADTDRDPADMDLDNPDESFVTVDSVGDCDRLEGAAAASQSSSLPSFNGSIAGPPNPPKMADDEPEEGEVDEEEEEQVQPQNKRKQDNEAENGGDESAKDDSLILVEEETEVICLDDTRADSPSLDDLRRKQEELLKQLEVQSPHVRNPPDTSNDDSLLEDVLEAEKLAEEQESNELASQPPTNPLLVPSRSMFSIGLMGPPPLPAAPPPPSDAPSTERPPEPEFLNLDEIKMTKIPFIDDPASMGLKKMSLGTPILTPFTPFNTLPCGDAFSKGVSDVINFENLPNSTGKYERMKSLLSKVRNVITAHNGETDGDSR